MKDKILSVSELYDIRVYITQRFTEGKDMLMIYYSFKEFCKLYNYFLKNHNDVKVFYDKRYDLILELETRYNTKDYFVFEQCNPSPSTTPVHSDHRLVYQYKLSLYDGRTEEIIKLMDSQLRTKNMFKSGHILSKEYKKLAFSFSINQGTKVIVLDKQIPVQHRVNEDKYSSTWIRIR